MLVLGIETSCDETAAALYDTQHGLLSNEVHTQIDTHLIYGGVVPELASREHAQYIKPVVDQALASANKSYIDLSGVAYTRGPGLVTALMVGASYAKALAFALNVQAIGVHHMEAHLLASQLGEQPPNFPFVAVLISGGHTQLMAVDALGDYQILGATLDDAIGEAFDKTAKLLGLPYPGGPALEKLVPHGRKGIVSLPRPMIRHAGCDMSLSGLKTAVAQFVMKKQAQDGDISEQLKADIALEFHHAITDMLIIKLGRALDKTGYRQVVIAGGVSANQFLRRALNDHFEQQGVKLFYPPMQFCTDNAAMVAYTGALRLERGQCDADLAIDVVARWPMDDGSLLL